MEKLSNICKLCGRPLKDLDSRRLGYGPICYEKVMRKKFKVNKLLKEKLLKNE
jgi:hypothetical protein